MVEALKISKLEIIALKDGQDLLDEQGGLKHENKKLTYDPHPSFSYAYCSDSRVKQELVEVVRGVDLLYHEATFTEEMRERAEATYHSTAHQAAELAQQAEVKKLILGHFSARYRELDPILEEAKNVFDRAELAIEGTKFVLSET